MITEQQYKEYKRLVEEYEAGLSMQDDKDDYPSFDDEDDYDPLETEFELCHCGAYQVSDKTGMIVKVSDCIC